MNGTLQLLTHLGLAGVLLGFGIFAFPDANVFVLAFSSLLWFVAYFHFADAVWIPSWGVGRDFVDRFGIAIRGVGFAMISICALLAPSVLSVAIGFAGLIMMLFGRILWELMLAGRPSSP